MAAEPLRRRPTTLQLLSPVKPVTELRRYLLFPVAQRLSQQRRRICPLHPRRRPPPLRSPSTVSNHAITFSGDVSIPLRTSLIPLGLNRVNQLAGTPTFAVAVRPAPPVPASSRRPGKIPDLLRAPRLQRKPLSPPEPSGAIPVLAPPRRRRASSARTCPCALPWPSTMRPSRPGPLLASGRDLPRPHLAQEAAFSPPNCAVGPRKRASDEDKEIGATEIDD